ncbi:predicted protein [Arabidopsis lyrata subsp. lyrata]|uniref:Predicted protein n=1 Tax=Arabidopsis lyrata subsp. lyrata TaxID=81972 RepID=D7L3J8_ARALL|nr:predicted protein [Arabidopsis lyrata subsp. lyrata]
MIHASNLQGIIVFAFVMATLGLQVLLESGRQLARSRPTESSVRAYRRAPLDSTELKRSCEAVQSLSSLKELMEQEGAIKRERAMVYAFIHQVISELGVASVSDETPLMMIFVPTIYALPWLFWVLE